MGAVRRSVHGGSLPLLVATVVCAHVRSPPCLLDMADWSALLDLRLTSCSLAAECNLSVIGDWCQLRQRQCQLERQQVPISHQNHAWKLWGVNMIRMALRARSQGEYTHTHTHTPVRSWGVRGVLLCKCSLQDPDQGPPTHADACTRHRSAKKTSIREGPHSIGVHVPTCMQSTRPRPRPPNCVNGRRGCRAGGCCGARRDQAQGRFCGACTSADVLAGYDVGNEVAPGAGLACSAVKQLQKWFESNRTLPAVRTTTYLPM
eukprot:1157765-Pelagomonas_calceolata.AAC.1